ncbi:protein of unknown function [Streptococcus thermophilus]|nr:protein of unknown function [Streptococcus thermophilus]CAD0149733.1 protein of unknown function [Streptococcus thermophilus]
MNIGKPYQVQHYPNDVTPSNEDTETSSRNQKASKYNTNNDISL